MIKNEIIHEIALQKALGHFLAEQPEDLTATEILTILDEHGNSSMWSLGREDLLIWEPFEGYTGSELAECIENLSDAIEFSFIDVAKEIQHYLAGKAIRMELPVEASVYEWGIVDWVINGEINERTDN